MRKVITMMMVLGLLASVSYAQFNTGSKTASGTISWSKNSYDGEEGISILIIAPSVGYFVMDNLAANVSLNMMTYSYPGDSDSESITGFGIGAKYYMNNFYGGGAFNLQKYEDQDALTSLLIEGGYLYGFNENVFLDIGLDYLMGLGDNKSTDITIGVGIATFF